MVVAFGIKGLGLGLNNRESVRFLSMDVLDDTRYVAQSTCSWHKHGYAVISLKCCNAHMLLLLNVNRYACCLAMHSTLKRLKIRPTFLFEQPFCRDRRRMYYVITRNTPLT
jgi:hypothetical protein